MSLNSIRKEDVCVVLTGSAGTGKMIMENLERFHFELIEKGKYGEDKEFIFYGFSWSFDQQYGTISIRLRVTDNFISSSSLIMTDSKSPNCFKRPLGLYNDNTLFDVFKLMMGKYGIEVKGFFND